MKYEYDIFISYHQDDDKASDGNIGWVSSFHIFLERLLTQLMGEKPRMVLSGTLNAEQLIDKSIATVSVLSPSYVNTVATVKEAEGIHRDRKSVV